MILNVFWSDDKKNRPTPIKKQLCFRRCVCSTRIFNVSESGIQKRNKTYQTYLYIRRSERSTRIFNVSDSGLQKHNKTYKTHLYFRWSERSTKMFNVSESGIQKQTKTCKNNSGSFAEVSVVQRFSMFRRMVFKT